MPGTPTSYELSVKADNDIDEIFDYTEAEYGFDQAIDYTLQFEDVFQQLVRNPELGRKRPEIRKGLRSFPKEQHIIFYRILNDRIRIVRILHSSRDLPGVLRK